MREIKFRAWDTKGYWVYPEGHPKRKFIQKMYYDVENLYDSCEGEATPGGRSFGHLLRNKRYIIMQYTGLKDKNGKEIYEGDIIKSEEGEIAHIEFETHILQDMTGNCFGSGFFPQSDVNIEDCEIIGNIYENEE